MNRKRKTWILLLVIFLLGLLYCLASLGVFAHRQENGVRPIANSPLHRLVTGSGPMIRYLPLGAPEPIAHVSVAQHPFMAANGGNNMHNDAAMSDTTEAAGPMGNNPEATSRSQGFGGYGTVTFDRQGRLVAVYSNASKFQLELMNPITLEELASYDLPPRPLKSLLSGVMPWEYIGAGMYFYLDEQDRAVIPTTRNAVQVVQIPTGDGDFTLAREYDLSNYVLPAQGRLQDSVAWVLPDWSGEYYWFATTGGVVGTLAMESGEVRTLRLADEIIENSFAIGEDGAFIISDRAVYRFELGKDGEIQTAWRSGYDRGPAKKPGHITRGSGSSVTLLGGVDGYVAVTDNAEPRIHALFIRRSDGALACSHPLFTKGKSGTDITLIGLQHADQEGAPLPQYSIVAENNWGRQVFPFSWIEPGVSRVDLVVDPGGQARCELVWTSPETNIGVFKMSLGNGLVYLYYKDLTPLVSKWYFTALDFRNGQVVYRRLAGTGLAYNNYEGALFIHPSGALYSTTIFGLTRIEDSH